MQTKQKLNYRVMPSSALRDDNDGIDNSMLIKIRSVGLMYQKYTGVDLLNPLSLS